jgi:hypothetical protein
MLKNVVFWDMMTACGSYKNSRFGGKYYLNLRGERF